VQKLVKILYQMLVFGKVSIWPHRRPEWETTKTHIYQTCTQLDL